MTTHSEPILSIERLLKVSKKSEIPAMSIIKKEECQYSYVDSFQGYVSVKDQPVGIDKVGSLFFSGGPDWANSLFTIRNRVVKIFGLKVPEKTDGNQELQGQRDYQPGERVGIFKLIDRSENELILGEEDKHLNFKVSLLLSEVEGDDSYKSVSITTAVKYNNFFGWLYFLPVKPFHQLIVRSSLKSILKKMGGS